jgi:hypothetical protein
MMPTMCWRVPCLIAPTGKPTRRGDREKRAQRTAPKIAEAQNAEAQKKGYFQKGHLEPPFSTSSFTPPI